MAFRASQSSLQFIQDLQLRFGDKTALSVRTSQGWESYSYRELVDKAFSLAGYLKEQGIRAGDHILVLSRSHPEFAVSFFANALVGARTVPLDMKLSLQDQLHIAEFSDAVAFISIDAESEKTAAAIAKSLPRFQNKVFRSQSVGASSYDFAESSLKPDDIALIAFTSGTTSSPKGVMLAWNQLLYQVDAIAEFFGDLSDLRMLSILPLHHMFEIVPGLLVPLAHGGNVHYANTLLPHQILEAMQTQKIRDMLVVPLFLRTLRKGIVSELQKSFAKRVWFHTVTFLAKLVTVKSFRRWLFKPILQKLGGEMRRIISGASALDKETGGFFEKMGIDVIEGYGLTETAPIVTCNPAGSGKKASVGRPLRGVEIRLVEDTNEILVRGPNVMKGYYKNPGATRACIDSEGWFNTGDVGEIDRDGFLKIVGRTKELVVLANGKKVVPDEVEDFFLLHPDVQEACVIGAPSTDRAAKGEVVTLVIGLKPEALSRYRSSQSDPIQFVISEMRRYGLGLSYYKRPTTILIATQSLPRTSTLKLKRTFVKSMVGNPSELNGEL